MVLFICFVINKRAGVGGGVVEARLGEPRILWRKHLGLCAGLECPVVLMSLPFSAGITDSIKHGYGFFVKVVSIQH